MHDYQKRQADMLHREAPQKILPWLAYDDVYNLVYCEGGYMGRIYDASLLSGIDNTSIVQLVGALNQEFESGTIIQLIKLSTPDITHVLAGYAQARNDLELDTELTAAQKHLLGSSTDAEVTHLQNKVEKQPLYSDSGVYLHTSRMVLCFKVPVGLVPSDSDIEEAARRINSATAAFTGAGLRLKEMSINEILAFIRRCFFIHEPFQTWWDQERLIRDQIFGPGDRMDQEGGYVNIEHDGREATLAAISVKHHPEQWALPLMNNLGGDPNGVRDQIRYPYLMSYSVYVPEQGSKKRSITNKSTALNYQAYGPLLRWIPKLAYRKKGMDALIHASEQGNRMVEVDFRVILYCPNQREAERAAQSYVTMAEGMKFMMARETQIHYPMFMNSLPLFPTVESIGLTQRYKTMAANQAAQFMPVLEDWQGTRTPIIMLTTRRGLPMPVNLYDATTNYNFFVSGDSGSGKSVFSQSVIWSYLSVGSACFIIEIGNSYRKLCDVFGGSHLRFHEDSNICINPFSTITELDEEIEILTSITETMIAPRDGLDDYKRALVREAIRSVFGKLGTRMTPTDVQSFLFSQEKEDPVALGKMMAEFCQGGAYGHWFHGPANIDLGAKLVVLELEELLAKESLRRVVELSLIQRVSKEMYSRRPGQKKMLFIDEASATLDGPGMQQFVTGAYERIRKHNGSVGIGIQDVMKLLASEGNTGAARAVIGLSTFKFLLAQPSGTVDLMKKESIMSEIGDWGYEQLKGLRTIQNLYSEVFVSSSMGRGVGRLQLDRYRQVLFSTRGAERDLLFKWMDDGLTGADAIARYLELEKTMDMAELAKRELAPPARHAPLTVGAAQ